MDKSVAACLAPAGPVFSTVLAHQSAYMRGGQRGQSPTLHHGEEGKLFRDDSNGGFGGGGRGAGGGRLGTVVS